MLLRARLMRTDQDRWLSSLNSTGTVITILNFAFSIIIGFLLIIGHGSGDDIFSRRLVEVGKVLHSTPLRHAGQIFRHPRLRLGLVRSARQQCH